MRRSATCLLAGTLILASSGCSAFQRKEKAEIEPAPPAGGQAVGSLDSYTPSVRESVYQPDSYSAYGSPTGIDDSYALGSTSSSTGADIGNTTAGQGSSWERRHHTVAKSDTLYRLARMYYGDQRRWKDIYEANRAEISDPNMIRVGQRLLIP